MKLSDEELKSLYRGQTSRSVRGNANCLSEETLILAAERKLNQSERERIADHLAACSDCAEEYRLIVSLKPLVDQTINSEKQDDARAVGSRSESNLFAARISFAAAAALLLISIALFIWAFRLRTERDVFAEQSAKAKAETESAKKEAQLLRGESAETKKRLEDLTSQNEKRIGEYEDRVAELRRETDELSRPQINVPIIDLDPRGAFSRSGAGNAVVKIPADANRFTLILNAMNRLTYARYELEIRDAKGRLVHHLTGLKKTDAGNFTVGLSRGSFSSGHYALKLYGVAKGRREPIEEYDVDF